MSGSWDELLTRHAESHISDMLRVMKSRGVAAEVLLARYPKYLREAVRLARQSVWRQRAKISPAPTSERPHRHGRNSAPQS